MTTHVIVDYRRNDERRFIYQPYWVTSAELIGTALAAKVGLVFSFPLTKYPSPQAVLIEEIAFQVTEAFVGGTITIDVGSCTLATDDVTTGGVATLVDEDEYVDTTGITQTLGTLNFAIAGDWLTAKVAALNAAPLRITPAASTVPAIGVYITTTTTITTGKGRVLMKVCEVPFV